ncbi:MAG: basic rane protein [Clostridia bacterium]|nr:basic rane protein [Clostridia bacterium]
MKRAALIAAALVLAMALLAGCGGGNTGSVKDTGSDNKAPSNKKGDIAMVTSGSLGDTGIFDSGNEGLTKSAKEFGLNYKVLEGKEDPSLYYDLLMTAAKDYKLVFVNPGYQFEKALGDIASKFPDTIFVYADGESPIQAPNIVSVGYKENEGSYLAGVMAGQLTSRTQLKGINPQKVVGLVGAMDIPVINNFIVGFKQGVKAVDPQVEVKVLFAGSFDDPAKGKELTLSLYDQGADIVYDVASKTGDGVILAAKEKGKYAIGVDTDKSPMAPENVTGSMLKNVGVSFYDTVKMWKEGSLKSGQTVKFGLKDKGVELLFDSYMKNFIPKDILDAVNKAQEDIIQGKITVDEVKK